MKLQLHVTPSKGAPFKFEHHGPNLRIGRDPESELVLEGDTSQSVSWNHARLEMTASGGYLIDLESTNGTFVNGKRIKDRAPFHQGDTIQLGYTGPKLKVLELGQAAAGQAKKAAAAGALPHQPGTTTVITKSLAATRGMLDSVQRTQRNMLIGMSVVGLVVLAGVVILLLRLGRETPTQVVEKPPEPKPVAVQPAPEAAPVVEKSAGGKSEEKGKTEVAVNPPVASQQPQANDKQPLAQPKAEPKPVGRYAAPDKGPPSILLQRQHEPDPWARLRPGDPAYTANYLVSLPGYRSKVYLDSKVHLTLWGNIPEFSKFPPVLESTVVLHEPPAGIDLDFTLDRGRVLLANYKERGAARVRVHFQNQVWELSLPDNKTEVVLELWGIFPREVQFSTEAGRKGPLEVVGLFVKGQAQLKTGQQEYQLGDLSRFTWASNSAAPMGPETLPKPPDWWTNKIDQTPQVQDMMLGLNDLSKALIKNTSVVDAVLTETREAGDVSNRVLGVLFLGAMDAVPYLLEALEDRQHPEVRGMAAYALRNWITHSADHDLELYRMLQEKKGFSKEKAEIVMRLLHSINETDAANPKTFEMLIGYLDHDNLAIRELAFWHLSLLAPEDLKKMKVLYDPAADAEKRKPGVEQWKKLLTDGKLPPKRAPASGG